MPRLLAAALAAYMGLLVFATHYPRPEELLGPNPPSDKTLHFVAYAVLAVLAAATWLTARRTASRGIATLAIALAAFLGPSLSNAMIAIGVTATPIFIRLTRGQTLAA